MLRARWVTLRARWVTLRARWVTLRAHWGTLRARWVAFTARAFVRTLGLTSKLDFTKWCVPREGLEQGRWVETLVARRHNTMPSLLHVYYTERGFGASFSYLSRTEGLKYG
jgi:hypothetical protein